MLKKPPSVIMKQPVKDRLKNVEREFNKKEHKLQKYDKDKEIIRDFKKKTPNTKTKVVPYIPVIDERHPEFYNEIIDVDVDYDSDDSNENIMYLNKRKKKLTKPDNNARRNVEEIQKMLDALPPSPFKKEYILRSSSKENKVGKGGKTKKKKRKNKKRKTCKKK